MNDIFYLEKLKNRSVKAFWKKAQRRQVSAFFGGLTQFNDVNVSNKNLKYLTKKLFISATVIFEILLVFIAGCGVIASVLLLIGLKAVSNTLKPCIILRILEHTLWFEISP